jgi:HEAT repeat protein
MTGPQQKHVFISYVRENKDQVDRLCQDLERHGVKVWLDRNSIKPGARWKDAIREAIRSGDYFIGCFSDAYTAKAKTYMNEELTLAIEELRQYGSDREWFIPVLLSECEVPVRSIGAGETLLDINWVPLYEDWNAGIRRILSVIKPIPPKIQLLISALRSEDSGVRRQAVEALGKIGADAKAAVLALIMVLKDKYELIEVREQAAAALGKIGPAAKAAVPALIMVLKDKYELIEVREQAAAALGKIGPAAKAAVPALIKVLKENYESIEVREQAEAVLGKIGPAAKAAVPALIRVLKDKYELTEVREQAATALVKIGSEAAPALIELLKGDDSVVGSNTMSILRAIGSEAVPALIKALKDKNENVSIRSRAVFVLSLIGPEAEEAVPYLVEALNDEN